MGFKGIEIDLLTFKINTPPQKKSKQRQAKAENSISITLIDDLAGGGQSKMSTFGRDID